MGNSDNMRKPFIQSSLFSLCVLLFFISCSTGQSRSTQMIPDHYEIKNRHNHSVSLEIVGDKKTNSFWMPQISNEEFLKALRESIINSRVFKEVIRNGESEYLLKVSLRDLGQPVEGYDMEVSLVTVWELTDLKSKELIWKDIIASTYIAKLEDAFVGATRLKLATEGAARKNIQLGIHELSQLNLN